MQDHPTMLEFQVLQQWSEALAEAERLARYQEALASRPEVRRRSPLAALRAFLGRAPARSRGSG